MSRPLTPAARDRLLKVCRLMASPHAGERSAAALTAARLLAKAGLGWEDVIAAAGPARAAAAPHFSGPDEDVHLAAYRAEVAFIRAHRHLLTRAEQLQFGWYSTEQAVPGPAARQAVAHHARVVRQRLEAQRGGS